MIEEELNVAIDHLKAAATWLPSCPKYRRPVCRKAGEAIKNLYEKKLNSHTKTISQPTANCPDSCLVKQSVDANYSSGLSALNN